MPAPLRPMTSSRSPRPTSKFTSANTSSAPNDFHSSVAVSTVRPGRRRLGEPDRERPPLRGVLRPGRPRGLARRPSRFLATRARLAVWPRIALACVLRRAISRVWRSASFESRSSSRFTRGEVLRVRALVLDDLAGALLRLAVDVHDARDRLVEEVEVVAHDEQRAAVRAQELEQPAAGVGVEVVGRLVEQEQLAPAEEDAHQLGAPPLAARQRAEVEVEPVGAQPDDRRRACGPRPRPRTRRRPRTPPGHRVKRSMFSRRRDSSSSAIRSFSMPGEQLVEPAAREHVREDGGVVGDGVAPGVLRQVAGERRAARRGRTGADRRHRGPGTGWSCRRRCGRPGPTLSPGRTCRVRAVDDPLPADLDHQATNGQHGNNSRYCGRGVDQSRARGVPNCRPSLNRCRCRTRSPRRRSHAGGVGSTSSPSWSRSPPGSWRWCC